MRSDEDQSKVRRRRKITTAIILAVSALMSALFLVYGILQRAEASKQKEQAESLRVELIRSREEAERAMQMAEQAQREAERQRALADEALQNCMKSK